MNDPAELRETDRIPADQLHRVVPIDPDAEPEEGSEEWERRHTARQLDIQAERQRADSGRSSS